MVSKVVTQNQDDSFHRHICNFERVEKRSILSRVTATKDGDRIVIGFINHLQVVTATNYNTVTDFHTTKHSTLLSSVCLHKSSRISNTGTIKVSLNHTLPIPLHYSTHNVFKARIKSSQADFLYSSVLLVQILSCLHASAATAHS
jgi:hypothetical protein